MLASRPINAAVIATCVLLALTGLFQRLRK
jgi:hypothetical protein